MEHRARDQHSRLGLEFEVERSRIIRLCAHITGNQGVAEDLAQETLVEAWRNADRLRDPSRERSWLNGIARNVCQRWARRRGRESAHVVNGDAAPKDDLPDPLHSQADSFDLEAQIERSELIDLLDRALDLLPPVTRAALIQQFVEERPQDEIAQHLGLSRGAVAMRVQRGKLLLRQALVERFPEDARSYGLLIQDNQWVETQLWCRVCGDQRLYGSLDTLAGTLILRCPACYPRLGITEAEAGTHHGVPVPLRSTDGYRIAYARLVEYGGIYLSRALARDRAQCLHCGEPAVVERALPPHMRNRARETYGVNVRCTQCGFLSYSSLSGLLLATPQGRRFKREYPRSRTLPEQEVEVDGRSTILSQFQSLTSNDSLVMVTDAATLRPVCSYWNGRVRTPPSQCGS